MAPKKRKLTEPIANPQKRCIVEPRSIPLQRYYHALKSSPVEIRENILDRLNVGELTNAYTKFIAKDMKKLIATAQANRFMRICLLNEIADSVIDNDWVALFERYVLNLNAKWTPQIDRICSKKTNQYYHQFIDDYSWRGTRTCKPLNITITLLVHPLRKMHGDVLINTCCARRKQQTRLDLIIAPFRSKSEPLWKPYVYNFTLHSNIQNSSIFYDSKAQTLYYTVFDSNPAIYRKKLTETHPPEIVLELSPTTHRKLFIAADGDHLHVVFQMRSICTLHANKRLYIYKDMRKNKEIRLNLDASEEIVSEICPFNNFLVVFCLKSYIMEYNLDPDVMQTVEPFKEPHCLLNPETFIYQVRRKNTYVVKVMTKSATKTIIHTIEKEAKYFISHSNQIFQIVPRSSEPSQKLLYYVEGNGSPPVLLPNNGTLTMNKFMIW